VAEEADSPGRGGGVSAELTVLYDADCRVCTRVAGRLAGLDRRRRLRFIPLQDAWRHEAPISRLAAELDLAAALHVVDREGRWASGGEAMLRAWEQLPALRPLARLARTPIVAPLVEPAYRAFAEHRGRFAWLAGTFSCRAGAGRDPA
jgi:predicted DCC family thiol-disulfide oxidoreductase YuxK